MRHRRSRRTLPNIGRIAGPASELAIASAQTVGHRSALMMQAFDEAEFTRMWTEKMQAAAEIWTAAAFRLPATQIMWLGLIWDQTARVAQTAAMCRSPADMAALPLRCMADGFSTWMEMSTQLMRDSVREADQGLRVISRVAGSNAKRLAKTRRR